MWFVDCVRGRMIVACNFRRKTTAAVCRRKGLHGECCRSPVYLIVAHDLPRIFSFRASGSLQRQWFDDSGEVETKRASRYGYRRPQEIKKSLFRFRISRIAPSSYNRVSSLDLFRRIYAREVFPVLLSSTESHFLFTNRKE